MMGMSFMRAATMTGVLCGLGLVMAADTPTPPSPQEILQGYGLVQDGKYFLLVQEENAVKQELNKVLPLVNNLDVLFNQWSANEHRKSTVVALNDELVAVDARINNVNAMFGQINPKDVLANQKRLELNQNLDSLRQYRGQVFTNRNQVQGSIAGPMIQQEHLGKVEKAREIFLKGYESLVPTVDKLNAAYGAASGDDKVKNAMKVLRQSKSVQFKLGPSESLVKALGRVKSAKDIMDPDYFTRQASRKKPRRK